MVLTSCVCLDNQCKKCANYKQEFDLEKYYKQNFDFG